MEEKQSFFLLHFIFFSPLSTMLFMEKYIPFLVVDNRSSKPCTTEPAVYCELLMLQFFMDTIFSEYEWCLPVFCFYVEQRLSCDSSWVTENRKALK